VKKNPDSDDTADKFRRFINLVKAAFIKPTNYLRCKGIEKNK
jgi:hypothetical protein